MTTLNTGALPSVTPSSGGESRAKAWGFTGLLVSLYVINWGDKAVLGLVAQPLMDELGLTTSQIGLAGSAFFLTYAVGSFLAGLFNKWMTLRWSLVLLSLVWAAVMLPMVVVAGFAVLLVTRMLLGLSEGPAIALVYTAVYTWHPKEKRGLPSACIAAAASIAKIAVAPGLALVIAMWGWRAAFLTLAMAGIVWCAIWLPIWKPGPYGAENVKKGSDAGDTSDGGDQRKAPWSKILLSSTFLGGVTGLFAMYGLVVVVLTWLPSYFEVGLGFSRVQAGAMFGFPSIAALVFMFLSTSVGDKLLVRGSSSRILRGIVPGIGLALSGAALVTLPYISAPALAVFVVSVGYGVGTVVFPLLNAGLSEICPPTQVAGAFGVFNGIMASSGVIAPYLTGLIVESAGDPAAGYALAFQVYGIVALVGAVVTLLAVNPVRDASRVMASTR